MNGTYGQFGEVSPKYLRTRGDWGLHCSLSLLNMGLLTVNVLHSLVA